MCVRLFRSAFVGIPGCFVFEEADDLEIRRLHVWANHFDGQLDAQWFGLKSLFLRLGCRIGRARGGDCQHERQTKSINFCFHDRGLWFAISLLFEPR